VGLRVSTLDERREFYSKEFCLKSVSSWIGARRGSMKMAMIPGRHSGIVAPAHSEDKDNVVIIDDWRNARDIRRYCLEWLPEGLYYDRNLYRDISQCSECGNRKRTCFGCYNHIGQQLAFDLDPENVDCPIHGHVGDRLARGEGLLSFCMIEFKMIRRQARELALEMKQHYEKVGIVFSGRGFHVIVDDEEAYALTSEERKSIARRVLKRYDIDEWVTIGSSRLMRLPYSLNALVSRKCVPIKEEKELRGFDPRTSSLVIPAFARSA
jgi:DNA primase catalytic subunit